MGVIVQKYGGSSVASASRLCRVADTEQAYSYSHDSAYRISSAQDGENARLSLLHGDFRRSGDVRQVRAVDMVFGNPRNRIRWLQPQQRVAGQGGQKLVHAGRDDGVRGHSNEVTSG